MSQTVNGFSLFNDVENKTLKAFNRYQIICNLIEMKTKGSRDLSKEYISHLSNEDRAAVVAIAAAVRANGLDTIKAYVTRECTQ